MGKWLVGGMLLAVDRRQRQRPHCDSRARLGGAAARQVLPVLRASQRPVHPLGLRRLAARTMAHPRARRHERSEHGVLSPAPAASSSAAIRFATRRTRAAFATWRCCLELPIEPSRVGEIDHAARQLRDPPSSAKTARRTCSTPSAASRVWPARRSRRRADVRYGSAKSPSAGGVTACSLGCASCGIQPYGTRYAR